jgi:ribosome biogenesis protein NSA1
LTGSENDNEVSPPCIASLPTGLCDWRLSQDATTFAYGGNEADLSVWNTEQAFSPPSEDSNVPTTKKRKRRDELLPGEIWRAKNVS